MSVRDGRRVGRYDAKGFSAGWRTAVALAADDLGDAETGEVTILVRNEPGFGGPRTWATALPVRGSIVERVLDWLGSPRPSTAEQNFLERVAHEEAMSWAR